MTRPRVLPVVTVGDADVTAQCERQVYSFWYDSCGVIDHVLGACAAKRWSFGQQEVSLKYAVSNNCRGSSASTLVTLTALLRKEELACNLVALGWTKSYRS